MASVRSAILVTMTLALGFGPGLVSQAAASAKPPYEVEFDSTMVNQFNGQDNDPQGSETTEIQAQIPLTKSGSTYTGSALSTYKQATGTISESCTSGDTHGTTTETELSGNPTTFSASYTPGPGGKGGEVTVNLGPFVGGLEESFQDVPGCGGPTEGNTTPRFVSDFYADHKAQFVFGEDASFTFTLTPGGSLGGPTSIAGTYDYTGGSTQGNLTYSETTSSDVTAENCVVPNVVGMTQGAAASALTNAECTVGAVTTATSNSAAGTVLSSSPAAGATLEPDAAVALVVSKGAGATCKVPDVKGDKLGAAKTKIRHAGCDVGTIKHRKTSKKHRGHVLSQSPHSGADKPAGTKVDLTVGK